MFLRCTQKLLKEIGAKSNDALLVEEPDTLLGNWYANIFTLDRRKTMIFMNERTLLSFIVFGYRKSQADQFGLFFIAGVERVLKMEDIEDSMILKILSQYDKIVLTKTSSKSLLGNMNDLVFLYTNFVLSEGGLKHANLNDVIYRVNRTPQTNLGGLYSASMIRQLTTVNLN